MSIDTLQEYYERQLRSLDEDGPDSLIDEDLRRIDNEIDDTYDEEQEVEELE